MVRKINTEIFISDSLEIHSGFYSYSKVNYINSKSKVIITCPIHGDFEQRAMNHLRGNGCAKCARESSKLGGNKFIKRAIELHGDKYDYSKVEYTYCRTNVIIICKEHGEFSQTPDKHLQGRGCPKCILKNQTKLFNKLKNEFLDEGILWEFSPEWLGKQRFDIYFPKYNIAVEYNGKQHYEVISRFGGVEGFENCLERDTLKRKKCLDNKCNLFELKYNYKEIDLEVLEKEITTIIKMFKNES
jgi:hypothetical protein